MPTNKLNSFRQADRLARGGKTVKEACGIAGISVATFYKKRRAERGKVKREPVETAPEPQPEKREARVDEKAPITLQTSPTMQGLANKLLIEDLEFHVKRLERENKLLSALLKEKL